MSITSKLNTANRKSKVAKVKIRAYLNRTLLIQTSKEYETLSIHFIDHFLYVFDQ
jgi:hypothetical protein